MTTTETLAAPQAAATGDGQTPSPSRRSESDLAPGALANVVRLALRREMEGRGLGVRALARAAGISHGGLSDFLNERNNAIQLETVAALARALDLSVAGLIGEAPAAAAAAAAFLRHDEIVPDPANPRGDITQESVERMAQSIQAVGLLTPLRVTPSGMLIAGERRWRAIGRLIAAGDWAGDRGIPVTVGAADGRDGDRRIEALVENLQREDMAPMAEARAIRQLVEDYGLTTSAVAMAVGCSQRHVQLRLDLVRKLAPAAQDALDKGEINLAAARALTLAAPERQETALGQIVDGDYGWQTAAEIARSLRNEMVPVGRELFPLEDWPGAIVEDPDDPGKRWFTDRALFLETQRAAAGAIKARLEAEGYQWVRVVDRTAHDEFQLWRYETDRRRKPETTGAAVEIQYDLSGVVHKGLFEQSPAPAPKPDKAARPAAEAPDAGPVKVTQKHMIACRQAKTDALQAAIAARPDIALRAAVLGLLAAGGGAVRVKMRRLDQKHDRPDSDTLARAVAPWAERFRGLEYAWSDLVLSVDPHDSAKQAKAWKILCGMDDAEISQLHAILVAQACGSWSGMAPALGDDPLACAIAESLDIAQAAGPIGEEYLKTCGRPQLLQILEAGGSGHDLKSAKMKDLVALALAEAQAGNLDGWMPPTLRFGSPEAIEKLLPKKGD